ncbi:putative YigZ family protein [Enterococcus sp. PF1-24]|uniref:YigZ family protein n=1 Tax=unclassified Enterococcus TaxID=2608891 RepID=UPI002474D4FC|nr:MULTISPECIES: YigZ family protein [unclassified Enterococcus]MDH6364742.1 putative YigZ family protein [Enterococcus sp. PFB1-1]MDH6401782.1 putative YigZ family protein [Enterococcus sp. PF1-24]
MIDSYFTIKENHTAEIEIKKSRFICSLKRVTTEEEAKAFIQEIKKEHWKASHNCNTFIIGEHSEIQRSSDDGEPSGTAGVPMLEVLKKNQLINVVAVVTRYFGGTKLGAGGLIRAYSQAVAHAIQEVGIVEGKLQKEMTVTIPYPLLGKVQNFIENQEINLVTTNFSENVSLICLVDETALADFQEKLIDLLNNQVTFTEGNTQYAETLVVKK